MKQTLRFILLHVGGDLSAKIYETTCSEVGTGVCICSRGRELVEGVFVGHRDYYY